MLKIINITDKTRWTFYVEQCDDYDFYHTWDYHKLSAENKEGIPELIVKEDNVSLICFPLLKREVIDASGKHQGYDYTSAYGYGGPIFKGVISDKIVEEFGKGFQSYCKRNNIISVFSRLHPIIKQGFLLRNIGKVKNNSITIQIDLTQSLEEQRKHYRKSNKSEINKLRKTTSIVWSEHSQSDIDEFIEIYEETMKRVNASERYFFNKTYYQNLFNSKDYKTKLVFIESEGIRLAGALFVFCKNFIQYHLAGTRTEYMRITPMKLILDEIRLYGTEKGFKNFHLGGGITSSSEDSLFRFKRGFSKIECEFNTFEYIADQEKYNKLSNQKKLNHGIKADVDFFPLYRS